MFRLAWICNLIQAMIWWSGNGSGNGNDSLNRASCHGLISVLHWKWHTKLYFYIQIAVGMVRASSFTPYRKPAKIIDVTTPEKGQIIEIPLGSSDEDDDFNDNGMHSSCGGGGREAWEESIQVKPVPVKASRKFVSWTKPRLCISANLSFSRWLGSLRTVSESGRLTCAAWSEGSCSCESTEEVKHFVLYYVSFRMMFRCWLYINDDCVTNLPLFCFQHLVLY